MPTAACGINCDVCKLNLKGVCSTCGHGTSDAGRTKAAAQVRILGQPCPILACAQLNQIRYCMADCTSFPCDNFEMGPYPFSQGFLSMQKRRLNDNSPAYAPDGSHLEVADLYWREAADRDATSLVNLTFFESMGSGRFQFRFLNQDMQIDLSSQLLLRRDPQGQWGAERDSLLTLVTVLYLKNVKEVFPLGKDIVSGKDLKEGHFFVGPHVFRTDPILRRYGEDIDGFRKACRTLDGIPMEMADAAYQLFAFPRLPIYLLLWQGDDEFKPRVQVLFERAIETILPADAIWALVSRVSMAFGAV